LGKTGKRLGAAGDVGADRLAARKSCSAVETANETVPSNTAMANATGEGLLNLRRQTTAAAERCALRLVYEEKRSERPP
jgi:hypothetical protein